MRRAHTIPTLLALLVLVVVIAGLSYGSSQMTRLFSRASTDTQSGQNVVVGNVDDTGWVVSWTTAAAQSGVVVYGSSQNLGDGIASDDREIVSPNGKYKTHFVSIKVRSSGEQFFCVGNDSSSVDVKNCSKQSVTIPEALTGSANLDPAYGKVIDPQNNGVAGALVTLEITGAQKMTAITKTDGTFVIPLSTLRSNDLTKFFSLDGEVSETITIVGPDLSKTTISCVTGLDHPFPNFVMGKNGDCKDFGNSQQNAKENSQKSQNLSDNVKDSANSGATVTGTNKFKTVKIQTNNVVTTDNVGSTNEPLNIQNGDVINNSLPTFSGKVNPGDVINVVVHSATPLSGTIRASADGSWSWTPPSNLAPGQHTVTLTITLASGVKQTVTRTFTVSPGVDILPITSGTPSASLTPTPTPTPTPILTPTPTIIIETPTPTITVTPPVTGDPTLVYGMLGIALILLLGGIVSIL